MLPLARKIRNYGLSAIALLLAASFALTGASIQTPDRLTRQQQRSRSQRSPRHRACPGLSQGHCVFQASSVNANKPFGPFPVDILPTLGATPEFTAGELLSARAVPSPASAPRSPQSLPRPPPPAYSSSSPFPRQP